MKSIAGEHVGDQAANPHLCSKHLPITELWDLGIAWVTEGKALGLLRIEGTRTSLPPQKAKTFKETWPH